jgi:hypothetical protein
MGGGAGDSGRVGGLSFDKPSGATSSGGNKASSANTGGNKASSVDKGEKKGLFSGIKDFFSGGGKGNTGPTAANRPKARPEVLKTGTGKDTRYLDTKTGKSYAAPSYGAFSFKGLTSNDPANVARNRYGAERAMAAQAERDKRDGPDRKDRKKSGIASLAQTPAATAPAPTSAELAAIGAPTTPMAPIFVDSPAYTQYDSLDVLGPVGGYGTAFGPVGGYGTPTFDAMGNPQPLPINWMDIFNTYPDFNTR